MVGLAASTRISKGMSREGPTDLTIPEQHFKSCRGCMYFESAPIVCGADFVEKQTKCLHPDLKATDSEIPGVVFLGHTAGKVIQFRTRDHEHHTPAWCPVLTQTKTV